MVALREALSDSCPRAKHLVFEGEGAGWDLSPCLVLWLFSSLEPFSNLLSLSSQAALKRDPLDSLASGNGLRTSGCLTGLPHAWGDNLVGTEQLLCPRETPVLGCRGMQPRGDFCPNRQLVNIFPFQPTVALRQQTAPNYFPASGNHLLWQNPGPESSVGNEHQLRV